ncbi:hypothetical protein CUZ96_0103 [Enterococcus lactis]|nr:hypothetical protein [Enterococcus lactis]
MTNKHSYEMKKSKDETKKHQEKHSSVYSTINKFLRTKKPSFLSKRRLKDNFY